MWFIMYQQIYFFKEFLTFRHKTQVCGDVTFGFLLGGAFDLRLRWESATDGRDAGAPRNLLAGSAGFFAAGRPPRMPGDGLKYRNTVTEPSSMFTVWPRCWICNSKIESTWGCSNYLSNIFFLHDHKHSYVALTFGYDLDSVQVKQHDKYLSQRPFTSKVDCPGHQHIHTRPTALSGPINWLIITTLS